jgi:hypothetical protein
VGLFFIDTNSGQVATHRQLIDVGISPDSDDPPRPWHRVRGNIDSSTMWYAVMRKRTNGIFIGTLVFRHSDHHASLLAEGWEEVDVDTIRANTSPSGSGSLAGTRLAAPSREPGQERK